MTKSKSSGAYSELLDAQEAESIRALPTPGRGERPAFHALPRSEQWQAVLEIVETRGAELCLAYPDVISVSAGYKAYDRSKTGERRSSKYPCIRFLVRMKKPLAEIGQKHERVPGHILYYWTFNGERKRVAIPTDVVDAGEFSDVVPHVGAPRIRNRIAVTSRDGAIEDNGVVACAIQRDKFPERIYFLGCKHVLNLSLKTYGTNHWGAPIRRKQTGTPVGKTVVVAGKLANSPIKSFDAQLGWAIDLSHLHNVARDPNFSGQARGPQHIPGIFYIHTPAGPVKMKLDSYETNWVLNYLVTGLTAVVHELLMLSHRLAGPALVGGFSGSPLFSGKTGGRFLGMHIAGSSNRSFAIPAWKLTDPRNYKNVAPGERWRVRPIRNGG